MSIVLDALTFGRLLDLVMPGAGPTPAEVRAILQLAQLAAGIDLDDDDAERSLLGALTRRLCASAEIPVSSVPVLSPLPGDAEERNAQIGALASQLVTAPSRELAFVVAYLLIVSDLELAPLELELLEALRRALCIDGSRATDLLAEASELVTPGARAELEPPAA